MLQKPNLSNANIVTCLHDSFGLTVTELEFLPIGNDNLAWVYRALADGGETYFLKVRQGPIDEVSLLVPRSLEDAGVTRVVAPIQATTGEQPWGIVDDFGLILYPFIRGQTAMSVGLTDRQWVEYGTILAAIHAARLPEDVLWKISRESFVSTWATGARRVLDNIESVDDRDPHARELVALWKERRDQIADILERTEKLGRQLRGRHIDRVVCHTDPHLANVLLDADGRLFMVDWDAPLLAPKERDLHFVIDTAIGRSVIGPREEELIFRGYGPTTIDWPALTYFRYEWLCGDLLGFADAVLVVADPGDAAKASAIEKTRGMFAAGCALELAYDLERRSARR